MGVGSPSGVWGHPTEFGGHSARFGFPQLDLGFTQLGLGFTQVGLGVIQMDLGSPGGIWGSPSCVWGSLSNVWGHPNGFGVTQMGLRGTQLGLGIAQQSLGSAGGFGKPGIAGIELRDLGALGPALGGRSQSRTGRDELLWPWNRAPGWNSAKILLLPGSGTRIPLFPQSRCVLLGDAGFGVWDLGTERICKPGPDPGRAGAAAAQGGGCGGLGSVGFSGRILSRFVAGNSWKTSPGHS